jgi:hypothetical protein
MESLPEDDLRFFLAAGARAGAMLVQRRIFVNERALLTGVLQRSHGWRGRVGSE